VQGKNKKIYGKIKEIHAIFTTDEKLQWEIHHKVSTNLSESANFVVTKFLPKHKHYGTTIVDKSRVSLAVCIILNGYEKNMVELYKRLGFDEDLLRTKGGKDMDDVREYNKRYHKIELVRRKRVIRNTLSRKESRKKEEKQKRKGEHYSGGMGLNEDTTQSALNKGTRHNKRKKIRTAANDGKVKRTSCKYCGRIDHVNFSKKCPYHDLYVSQPGNDLVIVAEMKSSYPRGMHLNKVVEVDEEAFVDDTTVENTGKWEEIYCETIVNCEWV
jgi:hypothetical protein